MVRLIEVSSSVWLENYQSFSITGRLARPHVYDNLFCSMQWVGKDIFTKSEKKHWAMEADHNQVSFLQSYFLSKSVIRLRGLCTKPEFQNQGHMKNMIELVLEKYQHRAEQAVCFVSESGIPVCKAAGFTLDERFHPRHVEYRDSKNRSWLQDKTSKIYLFRRKILV